MNLYQGMILSLCFCLLLLEQLLGLKHDTIVLSKNLSGSIHRLIVDGATVMSQEFYKDHGLLQTLILQPTMPSYRLMVQFIYLDIERSQPCQDYLQICEAPASSNSPGLSCLMPMVQEICGSLNDLFPKKRKRHFITSQAGRNLLLTWRTQSPTGKHRGFRITVTAISGYDCQGTTRWKCSDDMCISSDLHCDKIAHCLDISDEIVNCSNSDLLPSIYKCDTGGGSFPCVNSKWNERWFGVAIPMLIVLILFLVALIVKVRNIICRAPETQGGVVATQAGLWHIRPPRRRRRRSSQTQAPSSDHSVEPQLHGNLYSELLHGSQQEGMSGGRHVAYDPVNMMLLPPPYSPATQSSDHQYHPPTEGEPPPVYEEYPSEPVNPHCIDQSFNEENKNT